MFVIASYLDEAILNNGHTKHLVQDKGRYVRKMHLMMKALAKGLHRLS